MEDSGMVGIDVITTTTQLMECLERNGAVFANS
jgi:hypothetical protein